MREIEKALAMFKNRCEDCNAKNTRCCAVCSHDKAMAALEKQIPNKPVYHNMPSNFYWVCPQCGKIYWEKAFIYNYCDSCGQRLELEVEE